MHAIATAPGLHIAHSDGQYVVETDARGIGVAGCLYEMIDGLLHPVWYVSYKFSNAERNYAHGTRKCLQSSILCASFGPICRVEDSGCIPITNR